MTLFNGEEKRSLLEDYSVEKELGTGSYGSVYLAKHRRSGELHAIKVVKIERPTEKEFREKCHEIDILRILDHPNILRIIKFYREHSFLYMVTELCKGKDLVDNLEKILGNEVLIRKIMKQIIRALLYCKTKNIVHRDLKPDNILFVDPIEKGHKLKIIDFGLSLFSRSAYAVKRPGSKFYSAPEVNMDNDFKDPICDMWSAGVIMYVLLMGQLPFKDINPEKVKSDLEAKTIFNNIKSLSKPGKKFLQRLLNWNPLKRITPEEALKDAWFKNKAKAENVEARNDLENLKKIEKFKAHTEIKNAVYLFISNFLIQEEERKDFEKHFKLLDMNKDGSISLQELTEGFQKICGCVKQEVKLQEIMQNVDLNQNNLIDYSEFLMVMSQIYRKIDENRLDKAFRLFDLDKDGSISLEEFYEIFGDDENFDKGLVRNFFQELDKDKNNKVNFDEFKHAFLETYNNMKDEFAPENWNGKIDEKVMACRPSSIEAFPEK